MSDSTRSPVFIHLNGSLDTASVRRLMREIHEKKPCRSTVRLLGGLALLQPAERLAENYKQLLRILPLRPIFRILRDGLLEEERRALLELEDLGFSPRSLEVAHALLNVKERWWLVRLTRKNFKKFREEQTGFIVLD